MATAILRLPALLTRIGFSKSTLYLRISQGLWPKPVALGTRMSGWPETEVDALIAALMAGKAETDIRDLVAELQTARKKAA